MKPKQILRIAGVLVAVAATITAFAALDNAKLNPTASLALGVAALGLFKGSELW